MRFSPEGISNCGADVANWSIGVVDPESKFGERTGSVEVKALISCSEMCPLDNVELPNGQVPFVSDVSLQSFFDANCPMSPDSLTSQYQLCCQENRADLQ